MSEIRDEDGRLLIRDPSGDLVYAPDSSEPTRDLLPLFAPTRLCEEHGAIGQRAATCVCCWGEIKGGDRPRRYLGRVYEGRTE